MTLDTLQLGKELVSLLTILTPFTVLPVYVSLTADMPDAARRRALLKTLGTVLATLLFFQWTGMYLFRILGIELPSFQIAGGLIIASIAWSMLHANPSRIQSTRTEDQEGMEKEDFSVVPLAIPMLSGPGAITTVILLSQQQQRIAGDLSLSALILVATLILYPVFRLAHPIFARLGVTGTRILTRVMGMLLLAIAIEFVVQGVHQSLPAALRAG
ncbi:MAG TPA: MarC family protein [Acidiferrobacterales bacterium]|nr:MarC family protein [Acidiferrobacterales bacterium]